MNAKDVMTTSIVTVSPDEDMRTIARRLLDRHVSAAPVVDRDGRLIGLVSEGDLMRRSDIGTERQPSWWLRLIASSTEQAQEYVKSHGRIASDVMSRGVVTVGEDASLAEIAQTLERHRIKRVPVLRDGKLVGIVSRADLLRGLASASEGPKPVSAGDARVKMAVERAIKNAGARTDFVSVVVSDGVVNLWGSVESEAEKRAVQLAAEATAGVQGVENEIHVSPQLYQTALWV